MKRIVGYDVNRVWRVHAETLGEAHLEAMAYVKRRPDTGPLDSWTFKTQRIDPRDGYIISEEEI